MGNCLLKFWSKDQPYIAQSSGEAELYGANRGAKEGLGIKSVLKEMGIEAKMELQIDASAAEGILQRRGLGKLRHVETQELWTQAALQEGKFKLSRIDTKENTADAGTKPLSRDVLERLLKKMGYLSPTCGK